MCFQYDRCFVKATGWFEVNDKLCISMEYLPLGDLHHYMQRISGPLREPDVRAIIFQIVEGVRFMHREGFAHRDLKLLVSIS